jgi:aldose 1-epimerase
MRTILSLVLSSVDLPTGKSVAVRFEEALVYLEGGNNTNVCLYRIGEGKFSINGQEYQLPINNGPNALHGGLKGFDKKIWDVEVLSESPASIRLSYVSADGEEGYPGQLTTHVTYTVTDSNDLQIEYEAVTDKDTVLNLTNHTYFNLAGVELNSKILDTEVTMNGVESYLELDDNSLPTGKVIPLSQVQAMDFTGSNAGKTIGSRISSVQGGGYDHPYVIHNNFVLDTTTLPLKKDVFVARAPETGITLSMATTEPGFQFYVGKHIADNVFTGKKSQNNVPGIGPFSGFCLESARNPDAPNKENWRSSVLLTPGEQYKSKTVYTFGVQQ